MLPLRFALVWIVVMLAASVGALGIPVTDLDQWKTLSFRNIPSNTVSVVDSALHVKVNKSASPLVYKLAQPTVINAITVKARWAGALALSESRLQGSKGVDDFVLKLGVVESGEQTLNWLQRRMAPGWIKRLFKMAPQGTGVSRIHFLSTTHHAPALGSERVHPLSDLLFETRVHVVEGPGPIEWTYRFAEPVETLGLWLSIDGDDTGSVFDVSIEKIELHTL